MNCEGNLQKQKTKGQLNPIENERETRRSIDLVQAETAWLCRVESLRAFSGFHFTPCPTLRTAVSGIASLVTEERRHGIRRDKSLHSSKCWAITRDGSDARDRRRALAHGAFRDPPPLDFKGRASQVGWGRFSQRRPRFARHLRWKLTCSPPPTSPAASNYKRARGAFLGVRHSLTAISKSSPDTQALHTRARTASPAGEGKSSSSWSSSRHRTNSPIQCIRSGFHCRARL